MSTQDSHPYRGQTVVLTTKHKKYELVEPAIRGMTGLNVLLYEADTDILGTFSGEVSRTLTARESAIEKARMGTRSLGQSLGVASEGTIGPDPWLPFARSDIEHLAFVDEDLGIEIVEVYRSLDIIAGEIVTSPGAELSRFLKSVDFPNHKLMVTPNQGDIRDSVKGLGSTADLVEAIDYIAGKSQDGNVVLKSDLRAHCSPSRQRNIEKAAEMLAGRLSRLCPECKAPGWGVVGYRQGLNCSSCGGMVPTAKSSEILGCAKCGKEALGKQIAIQADPSRCDFCNP